MRDSEKIGTVEKVGAKWVAYEKGLNCVIKFKENTKTLATQRATEYRLHIQANGYGASPTQNRLQ